MLQPVTESLRSLNADIQFERQQVGKREAIAPAATAVGAHDVYGWCRPSPHRQTALHKSSSTAVRPKEASACSIPVHRLLFVHCSDTDCNCNCRKQT
jgi:hypothetical protein